MINVPDAIDVIHFQKRKQFVSVVLQLNGADVILTLLSSTAKLDTDRAIIETISPSQNLKYDIMGCITET